MKRVLSLLVCVLLLVSCSSENIDFLAIGGNQTKAGNNVYECMDLLEDADLHIESISDCEELAVSMSSFFDDNNLFPVYSGSTSNKVEFVKYARFKNDSTLIHYPDSVLKRYVEKLILDIDDLHIRTIKWRKNNEFFSTIALFDKNTGELLYDNVLFNIFHRGIPNSSKQYLNRGETPKYVEEYVSFQHDGEVAELDMLWCYSGYFYNQGGDSTHASWSYYRSEYCWEVYHNVYGPSFMSGVGNLFYTHEVEDNSLPFEGVYTVRIGIGAYGYNLPSVPISQPNVHEVHSTAYGNGYVYDKVVTR